MGAIKRMKEQATDWEKTLAKDIPGSKIIDEKYIKMTQIPNTDKTKF